MTAMVDTERETDPRTGSGTDTGGDAVLDLAGSTDIGVGPGVPLDADHVEELLPPLLAAVDGACDRVDAAVESALWSMSDADLAAAIAGCERLRGKTHALEVGLIGEVDQRGAGTRQGAASTAAWLRHRFRIRPGHAKQLVHTANVATDPDQTPGAQLDDVSRRSGRELLETGEALRAGAISPEHAAVVSKIMNKVPNEISVEQAARAESDLAAYCREYDPGTVAKLGDYMLEVMRTDTLDDEDRRRHRDRELQLNDHTGGLSGQLTREGMATLRSALDPLAAPAPSADGEPDPRSPGQRLADALVELARRALAADTFAGNHGLSHRIMVSIGLEALTAAGGNSEPDEPGTDPGSDVSSADQPGHSEPTPAGERPEARQRPTQSLSWAIGRRGGAACPAELEWGPLLSASTVLRLACHAGIQRVILDPAGAVLDVGRERRTVTPAQYAALIARDGGCSFPGCNRPASWCVAHHIKHWAHGGATNLDNLVLLCAHHHRVIHHHGWAVAISTADRLPTFYPPRWVDPDQYPRRNNRPRPG